MLDVLAPNRERTIARSIKSRKNFAGNSDGEKKEIKIKEDKCNSSPNSNEVYTITTCNFMFLLPFTWQEPQSEILSEIAVVGGQFAIQLCDLRLRLMWSVLDYIYKKQNQQSMYFWNFLLLAGGSDQTQKEREEREKIQKGVSNGEAICYEESTACHILL